MRVAQLVAPRELMLSERRAPEPGPGEVRIAVHVVGICGTDMEFYSGRRESGYPFILGHECTGIIDALGRGVKRRSLGERVTLRPNFGCGSCMRCNEGRDNICPNSRGMGVTIDGCLAQYILAPARYVFPLPMKMALETGVLIEPLAVAGRAVLRAAVGPGTRLLILGAGTIGLLAARCAALAGAAITVCDPLPERLSIAERLGAGVTLAPGRQLDAVRESGFDAVLETAGVAATVATALRMARPGGRVVLTGIPMEAAAIETKWMVWRELEVHGSFIYDAEDFEQAALRIQDGSVQACDFITHRFTLEEVADAFELVARHGGLKVLIKIAQEDA